VVRPRIDRRGDRQKRRRVLPGRGGGTVVGYASGAPHEDDDRATLAAIYVRPDRWGEGIGTALLDRFEAFCRERGCDAIDLEAIADNDVGTSFYRARGFEAVGTERVELFGEEATETLFRRPVE